MCGPHAQGELAGQALEHEKITDGLDRALEHDNIVSEQLFRALRLLSMRPSASVRRSHADRLV